MGKRYRVAVIGAGTMGSQHVASWQLAGHEVVSVVDMNLKLAQEIADKYKSIETGQPEPVIYE
jgi:predicted dehydrogenase